MKILRLLAALAITASLTAPSSAQGPSSPLVEFVVGSTWSGGYSAEIVLTNRSSTALSSWNLQFDNGPSVASLWNGVHSVSGAHHTVLNESWNGALAPQANVHIGFTGNATMTHDVANCTVNGTAAAVGYSLPSGWTSGGSSGGGGSAGQGATVEPRGPFWFPEDVNHDRVIDRRDTVLVQSALGQTGTPGPSFPRDVNRDGVVNSADVLAVTQRYGIVPTPSLFIGYWVEWGIYGRNFQPASIPFEKLTHVNYAFAQILPNGTVAPFDTYAAIDKYYSGDTSSQPFRGAYNQLNNVLKAAHPHIKTLISVGGWTLSGRFSDVALTPASRAVFSASCVSFIRTYHFDGVDIDWEYPGGGGLPTNVVRPEDKQNFTSLLAQLRSDLDAAGSVDGKRYLLSIAAPAGLDKIVNQEPANYHPYVNWINVMTYDFHGAWDLSSTGHHAGFRRNPTTPATFVNVNYNFETAMGHYLALGVPTRKLVPGLAAYGRAWSGVPATQFGLFQPATGIPPGTWDDWSSGATGVNDFSQIETFLAIGGYVRHFDPLAGAVFAYHPTNHGGHFISYEDPVTIAGKGNWLEQQHAGGFMLWELSGDRNEVLIDAALDQIGGRH